MKTFKFWIIGILLIFGMGYVTLRPSFNLALTGDDYLGLWRYDFYHNGWGGEKLNNISYFFTDYGPMDMMTATIHHFFGFRHQIYYIFSFMLRLFAALSFLWPMYKLTKSGWGSIGAAAFFIITTTGLEATDWSFNMPSYIAIAFANIFLGLFIYSRTKNNLFTWIASPVTFVLTIISQPVRTMFFPILILGLEIYWLVTNFNLKNLCLEIIKIGLWIVLTMTILKYTSYGGAVSLRGSKILSQNFQQVVQLIKDKNYKILVSPVGQIGRIILPNDFMYQRTEIWGLSRTFRHVVPSAFIIFMVGLFVLRATRWQLIISTVLSIGWIMVIWQMFMQPQGYQLQPFELLAYLLGGHIIILIIIGWLSVKNKYIRFGIFLSLLFIISGFILFWVRSPGVIHEITGRYLIVSGAGLAWLLGIMLVIGIKTKNIALIIVFGLLFSLHAKTSYKYLNHLSDVRGIEQTEKLRNSIKPAKNFGNPNVALVFYFEGDEPEVLQHAFIFGFPVISHYQFGISGPWYNIAPTNIWAEVESAYLDGQSLKRFMPGPWVSTDLENIYAYRLENRQLIDITEEKRVMLKNLKTKLQPLF